MTGTSEYSLASCLLLLASIKNSKLSIVNYQLSIKKVLEKLESRRITPDKQLPPMQFLFRLFGRPCFPRGELVAVTGKAKSGKTFVISMLMTLCARNDVLAFSRFSMPDDSASAVPLRMLWIDTEQSEESTQDIMCHRIIPMGGASLFCGEAPGVVFNLRGEYWQERLPMVEAAVRHYQPDLVIIDGIRDLVNDINDGVLAQAVLEQLMHLASDMQCCMVCVLHQNKSAEDRNLRGWIGTELMNKAFEVYACEKLMPQRVFALQQAMTRKYDIPDVMYYCVGSDGLPALTAAPVSTGGSRSAQPSTLPSLNDEYIIREADGRWSFNVYKIFCHAFGNRAQMAHRELQEAVMTLTNVRRYQTCAEIFQKAVSEHIIIKTQNTSGHIIYQLPPPP